MRFRSEAEKESRPLRKESSRTKVLGDFLIQERQDEESADFESADFPGGYQ